MKQVRRTVMRDGEEYQSVVDDVEILGDIQETDRGIAFDVVLAKEIVQTYRDHGCVYKPADELKKAAEVSGSVYITDGHPPQGIVKKQEQVYGEISADSLSFEDDDSRVVGRAEVFEDQAPEGFVQDIKDEERDSVSIGFYTQLDQSPGEWNDTEYDKVQRDILLDHLAVLKPSNEGRCSVENGCGIVQNMDQVTTPVSDREVMTSQGDEPEDDIPDYDLAVNEPEDPRDIADEISSLGYEVEIRDCNCGDHKGHLTIFDPEEDENSSDSGQTDDDSNTYLNGESKSSHKGSGANFMEDIESIYDLDMDDLEEHPEVSSLKDEKESLEDQVTDLEDEKESLEDELEEVRDELDSIKEEEADELRDELVDSFGIDEDELEDEDLEDLEKRKETLEAADLSRKDTTSTSPGQSNDAKSDNKIGTGGSGPHADKYNDED